MGFHVLNTLIYMVCRMFHAYVPLMLLNQNGVWSTEMNPRSSALFMELTRKEMTWESVHSCQSLIWQYGKQVISMYINIKIYKYVYTYNYTHNCLYHVASPVCFLIFIHTCHTDPTHKSMTHYSLVPSEALTQAKVVLEGRHEPLANGREHGT